MADDLNHRIARPTLGSMTWLYSGMQLLGWRPSYMWPLCQEVQDVTGLCWKFAYPNVWGYVNLQKGMITTSFYHLPLCTEILLLQDHVCLESFVWASYKMFSVFAHNIDYLLWLYCSCPYCSWWCLSKDWALRLTALSFIYKPDVLLGWINIIHWLVRYI